MHRETRSHDHLTELIARRPLIEAVMAQYLAGAHQGHAGPEEKRAARLLLALTIDALRDGADTPPVDDPAIRRHASRFGDGLGPILRDALGPDASDAFVAHCADRFWMTLRAAA